jgi:hypothetical protein
MLRALLVIPFLLVLGGCASFGQSLYDNKSKEECQTLTDPIARAECLDRVDAQRQKRP